MTQPPSRIPPSDDSAGMGGRTAVADVVSHVNDLQAKFELLKAQVRQAQQLSSLGIATAMIAHECNNLLTPIVSYAKAALDEDDPDLQRKALAVTVKNARMLISMSERVLAINAASPQSPDDVAIRAVAEDALATLCRDLAKDGIHFENKVDQSTTAWVDPLQLQQVLFNLFLNAREVMAPDHGGRLSIYARREGGSTVIEVANTGRPIPPDLLPHIFDTLQSSKMYERGGSRRCAGLGLALCRDLVEENHGTIDVRTGPEQGTTFTIRLPARRPAEA